jgi:sec-independent protein translocase protein TatA
MQGHIRIRSEKMFGLGPWEIVILGLLLFVIFGAKRIPEIGKGLGGAIRELKNVKKEITSKTDKPLPEGDEAREGEDASEGESLEKKVAGKVLNQVPAVRKAMSVKDKVDKVRKIIS